MKELDELNKIAVPTIRLIDDSTDAVLPQTDVPEDFDEDMIADEIANDVAEAQAKAVSAGQTFGNTEVATLMKAGRAKANAAGKSKLLGRGKHAHKPGGADPKDKVED